MVDYTKFSESTMLQDKYISITHSHIYEETNVSVNGEMISIIFYDDGTPSVARYDVFHYSWIDLKQAVYVIILGLGENGCWISSFIRSYTV